MLMGHCLGCSLVVLSCDCALLLTMFVCVCVCVCACVCVRTCICTFQKEITKHSIKTGGKIHNLCSDACLSAFQYSNKVDIKTCDLCNTRCGPFESSLHTVQYEGQQKRFCSDVCLTKFGLNHRKLAPCAWCGTQRENLDMIERVDANNKCHLFCSLNCLSLYRVNLQVGRLVRTPGSREDTVV